MRMALGRRRAPGLATLTGTPAATPFRKARFGKERPYKDAFAENFARSSRAHLRNNRGSLLLLQQPETARRVVSEYNAGLYIPVSEEEFQ